LELVLGDLATVQGVFDGDIHLRELGLLYVQDASTAVLLLSPKSKVPS
jgi:hypothetical protein